MTLRTEAVVCALDVSGGCVEDIELVFEIDRIFKDLNSGVFRKTKNPDPGIS